MSFPDFTCWLCRQKVNKEYVAAEEKHGKLLDFKGRYTHTKYVHCKDAACTGRACVYVAEYNEPSGI